jgi:hypothetical protein
VTRVWGEEARQAKLKMKKKIQDRGKGCGVCRNFLVVGDLVISTARR